MEYTSSLRNAEYAAFSIARYAGRACAKYWGAVPGALTLAAAATPVYAFHGGDDVPLVGGSVAFAGLFAMWAVVPSVLRNRRK